MPPQSPFDFSSEWSTPVHLGKHHFHVYHTGPITINLRENRELFYVILIRSTVRLKILGEYFADYNKIKYVQT